jgi:hypothetical protein
VGGRTSNWILDILPSMTENSSRHVWQETRKSLLIGFLPRHVMDIDFGQVSGDPRMESVARSLADEAFALADDTCGMLEAHCHELTSLEIDGLSGRIRYLVGIGIIASVVSRMRAPDGKDRLPWLLTVHSQVESRRPSSTYDLSNALAAVSFPTGIENPARALGDWVWIHLMTDTAGVHTRWIASTRRFQNVTGSNIVESADSLVAAIDDRFREAVVDPKAGEG